MTASITELPFTHQARKRTLSRDEDYARQWRPSRRVGVTLIPQGNGSARKLSVTEGARVPNTRGISFDSGCGPRTWAELFALRQSTGTETLADIMSSCRFHMLTS